MFLIDLKKAIDMEHIRDPRPRREVALLLLGL